MTTPAASTSAPATASTDVLTTALSAFGNINWGEIGATIANKGKDLGQDFVTAEHVAAAVGSSLANSGIATVAKAGQEVTTYLPFAQKLIALGEEFFGITPPPLPDRGRAMPAALTAANVNAVVSLMGPIIRILEGKGTLTDDEAAANAVLDAVAFFDPAIAPIVAMIETAEPALAMIVALAKAGGITGGLPPSIEPGLGPHPWGAP